METKAGARACFFVLFKDYSSGLKKTIKKNIKGEENENVDYDSFSQFYFGLFV